MKLYWSVDKIPELAGLSPEQQKQAMQFCVKKYAFKLWQLWLCIFLLVVLGVVVRLVFQFSGTVADAIAGGIVGGIAWLTIVNSLRPQLHDYVRKNFRR